MNTKTKQVEMRSSKFTVDGGNALQKGTDFLRAFTLGFDVDVQTLQNGADSRMQSHCYVWMIYISRHSLFRMSNHLYMDSIYHAPLADWQDITGGQSLRSRIVPGLGSSWPIIKYTFLEVMKIFGWRGRVFVGSF
jgi:hypothetical protein